MRHRQNQSAEASRLHRLAASIDALAEKDELLLRRGHEIAELRERAAAELHRFCSEFTESVNSLLTRRDIKLDPPEYPAGSFRKEGANLFQINARGRILQIEFEAGPQDVSTEEFRIPYIMEGSIRSFNQEWLERNTIEEQLIFYCLEKSRNQWRFFDARTYRSGPFSQDYLISLMEQLI